MAAPPHEVGWLAAVLWVFGGFTALAVVEGLGGCPPCAEMNLSGILSELLGGMR